MALDLMAVLGDLGAEGDTPLHSAFSGGGRLGALLRMIKTQGCAWFHCRATGGCESFSDCGGRQRPPFFCACLFARLWPFSVREADNRCVAEELTKQSKSGLA
jgi:hypothetical protein